MKECWVAHKITWQDEGPARKMIENNRSFVRGPTAEIMLKKCTCLHVPLVPLVPTDRSFPGTTTVAHTRE